MDKGDFTAWQKAMIEHVRGMFEGLFQSAVMSGMEVTPGAGLSVDVSQGLASGPSGYFHCTQASSGVPLSAPTGANPVKCVIVTQPNLVDDSWITRPTNPFDVVPLTTAQATKFVAVYGTPAPSPTYPVKGVNDVVLAGIQIAPGATGILVGDIDYSVREIVGKNSFQDLQPAVRVTDKTAAYMAQYNREIIRCDAAGGAFQVDLPDATLVEGYEFTVKKVDTGANVVTVAPNVGGQTLEGLSSYSLSEPGQFVTFYSNGSNYEIKAAG